MKTNKKSRWQEAQRFELNDWANMPNIVENEWQELVNKYQKYFESLPKKLKITDSSKILDIGCGPTCVCRLFPKGKKFGVEPLAQKLGIIGRVKGVKVVEGIGEKIPFEKDFFDLVICRNVIDHTDNPLKVVGEANRVLKDGGYFILSSYVYPPFIKLVKQFSELFPQLRNVGHPHTFSEISLEKLLAGFEIIERKVIHTGYHPNDYAKVDEKVGRLSFLQRLVIFINFKVLRQKWFLREYSLLARKI